MKLVGIYYGLFLEDHGGKCCGVKHLHSFPEFADRDDPTAERKVEWVKKACADAIDMTDYDDEDFDEEDQVGRRASWHVAVEVILSENQWEQWEKVVLAAGFKAVYDFVNSNTDNVCRVYLFTTGMS